MKWFFYRVLLLFAHIAAFFIGIVKGQYAGKKWIYKMKLRFAENKPAKSAAYPDEVMLDDIEMAAFHNN